MCISCIVQLIDGSTITLEPSYVLPLLRRFSAMINSLRSATLHTLREKERGERSKETSKGKKSACHSIFRAIILLAFSVRTDTRYISACCDEHGNSNDTIFLRETNRGPLFTRLYETFAYDESAAITIQSPPLGFVCILSSPRCFFLYIRPWSSTCVRRLGYACFSSPFLLLASFSLSFFFYLRLPVVV